MPSATKPIATEVAALAIAAMLWCSASQKRLVPEPLGVLGELAAAVQRGLRRATLRDLCQVQDRQRHQNPVNTSSK